MNILEINDFFDLSKTTKVFKKSYYIALLILATIAIGNYFVISEVLKAQSNVSELRSEVIEHELQYRRIKELLSLSLSNLTGEDISPVHKLIQLELKGLVEKLKQNKLKLEKNILSPRSRLSIWMGFPKIVTNSVTLLSTHSKEIETQLEKFILLDSTLVKWHFSTWAPLVLKLAEKGEVLENVKTTIKELQQKTIIITKKSVTIHQILIVGTLLTLLLEYLFIFHPLIRRLSISYKRIETVNTELKYNATHDDMTKIGNRRLFIEILKQKTRKPFSLFLIDLGDFKNINDVHGTMGGDHVLHILTSRFQDLISNSSHLFRLGGDQFIIMTYELSNTIEVEKLAHKLISNIAKPINYAGKIILMRCAIGISIIDPKEKAIDTEQVLKQLNFSLRVAKKSKQLCFNIFNTIDNGKNIPQAQLYALITNAIKNKEIIPFYQPIINIDNGEIIGAEALARWVSKDYGIIAPSEFLPIIEELNLMNDLTEIILEQVNSDHEKLEASGIHSKFISVNFPESILTDPQLPEKISQLCGKKNIDYLHVEILETVLLHQSSEIINNNLKALIKLGVKISMDDFGTGYASLSHLLDFPCHTLKIDRCFVSNIPFDNGSQLITRGIIDIALGLGLNLIAEGIETKEQSKFFSEWPMIAGQGYLFHHPQPFPSFINLFKGNNNVLST